MSARNPELLILAVALVALCLAPVASRLVGRIGEQISSELDGGRTGTALSSHLDSEYEGATRDDEIAQMIEARDFLRGETTADIEAEVRQLGRPRPTTCARRSASSSSRRTSVVCARVRIRWTSRQRSYAGWPGPWVPTAGISRGVYAPTNPSPAGPPVGR